MFNTNTKTEQSSTRKISDVPCFLQWTLNTTLVNMEKWSLPNSNRGKASLRSMEKSLQGSCHSIFSVLGKACVLSHSSCVRLFVTLWTAAHQAPLPMSQARVLQWGGLPWPPLGDFPNRGTRPASLRSSCIGRRVLYHCCHLGSAWYGFITKWTLRIGLFVDDTKLRGLYDHWIIGLDSKLFQWS